MPHLNTPAPPDSPAARATPTRERAPPQFALRHLLLATTLVACAFALLPVRAAATFCAGGTIVLMIWLQYRLGWFRPAKLDLTEFETHIIIAHDRLATYRIVVGLVLTFPVLGTFGAIFSPRDGPAPYWVDIFWIIWTLFSIIAVLGGAHLWREASRPYVLTRRGEIYRAARRSCRRIGRITSDAAVQIERKTNDGGDSYHVRLIPGQGKIVPIAPIPHQGFPDRLEAERIAQLIADFTNTPLRRLGISPPSSTQSAGTE
jgi:hypothetical protein